MNNSTISVIVPVYNADAHLHRCYQSVKSQTYPQWELVFVNDGSRDNSGKICDQIAAVDHRVKVLHQKNAGVSAARNAGIEASSGEMIMFVDADDEITCDCMEVLQHVMIDTNADVVSGRTCDDSCLWKFKKDVVIWHGKEGVENSLMDDPLTYSACAKLYTRDIIGETRFLTGVKINEDSFFVFQILCKKTSFVGINHGVYRYHDTIGSASREEFTDKFFDILKVAERKNDIVINTFPEFCSLADNMKLKARMNLLHILALRTKKEYCDLEKELIRYICANKNAYISAKKSDDRWMFIVQHGLYYPYKILMRLKKGNVRS